MTIQVKSTQGGVLVELRSDDPHHPVTATEFVPNAGAGITVGELVEALEIASDLSNYDLSGLSEAEAEIQLREAGLRRHLNGHQVADNDPAIESQFDAERGEGL